MAELGTQLTRVERGQPRGGARSTRTDNGPGPRRADRRCGADRPRHRRHRRSDSASPISRTPPFRSGAAAFDRGDLGRGASCCRSADAAACGKLGGWAQTLANAVDLAKVDAGFRQAVEPALRQLGDALDAAPLDMLPAGARETLQGIRTIDQRSARGRDRGRPRAANNVVGAGTPTGRAGDNQVTWTLDADGRPTRAQATLTELHDGTPARAPSNAPRAPPAARGSRATRAAIPSATASCPDQGTVNMFPQAGQFQQQRLPHDGERMGRRIDAGAEVRVDVQLGGYNGTRPSDVDVSYEVLNAQGERIYSTFEMFENVPADLDRAPPPIVRAMGNQQPASRTTWILTRRRRSRVASSSAVGDHGRGIRG